MRSDDARVDDLLAEFLGEHEPSRTPIILVPEQEPAHRPQDDADRCDTDNRCEIDNACDIRNVEAPTIIVEATRVEPELAAAEAPIARRIAAIAIGGVVGAVVGVMLYVALLR